MARKHYPWLPARLLLRIRYDSLSRIPSIRCPLLVLHSPEDDVVPFDMAVSLLAAAPQPKSFGQLERGHNDGGIAVSPKGQQALRTFLDDVLCDR